MFKNYFRDIDGIASYPIVLLVMFSIFFVLMILWIWRTDKNYFKEQGRIPLNDNATRSGFENKSRLSDDL